MPTIPNMSKEKKEEDEDKGTVALSGPGEAVVELSSVGVTAGDEEVGAVVENEGEGLGAATPTVVMADGIPGSCQFRVDVIMSRS